jgi:hypothetical protein
MPLQKRVYSENETVITAQNLNDIQDAIIALENNGGSGGSGGDVTGVKGTNESSYRTGNVNITKANIGLGNVDNKSAATLKSEIMTSANIIAALGYTPSSGPSGGGTEYTSMTIDQATDGTSTTPQVITAFVLNSALEAKGYTTNQGTITGIRMNNNVVGTSGLIDLGTVLTQHQDISGKVDKITGKGLSTNDYSAVEKQKVQNIKNMAYLEYEFYSTVEI